MSEADAATLALPGEAQPDIAAESVGAGARVALALLTLVAIAILFAMAMTRPVSYDEDQHIAAGVLAQTLLPYRDFAYLQSPLYPFLLAGLFKLDGGYHLLAARLLTFALSLLAATLLWQILRRLGARLGLAATLLAACLTSPFLAQPLDSARNDMLPLTLMLAALLLHLRAADRSWWARVAVAVLLGLAVEAKVSYVFGPLVLGLHAMFDPRRRLAPFVLGSLVAAIPAVLCFREAPEAFRFGLYGFHLVGPADWYTRQGLDDMLQPAGRLITVSGWLALGGNLALLVLAAGLSVVAMARRRKWKRPGRLLLGLFLAALLFAAIPSPSWAEYFAATAPLLACCIAHLDRITTHLADPVRKRILVVVAAFATVPVLLLDLPDLSRLLRHSDWVGFEAHRIALAIHAATPGSGDVATLFPHLTVDANPLRPAFATGPFIFRSGDAFDPALLARLHALAPATLETAFAADPPAAIYAGAYEGAWKSPMDGPLTAWAQAHGWTVVREDPGGAKLWLPPPPQPASR